MEAHHTRRRRRFRGRLLSRLRPKLTAGVAVIAATGALAASQPAQAHPGGHGRTVDLQVLALNDFHGALEEPSGSSGRVTYEHEDGTTEQIDAGGVEYLASALREERRGEQRSLTVAAGDTVGGTPLLSGLFHDEPTIEAFNQLGVDVAGVGNHEFDEGWEELIRLQEGGCHPEDGCYAEDREFEGADYPILAANVVQEDTGEPITKPYTIQKVKGVKVGFIGVTLEGTAGIVTQEGIEGLEFLDEVETVNRYTAELKAKGVDAVIALVHEGGYASSDSYNYDCDAGGDGSGISGPIVDIAENIDAGVDAIITGHTHEAYVCTIDDPEGNDRLVTSAASNGRLYTELNMEYDLRTGDIVRTSVTGSNQVVDREGEKASDMTDLIDYWSELAGPVANEAIGYVAEDISRSGSNGSPESPLGDLIADAQLSHARTLDPDTDIALMNPGGIRTDLTYAASGEEGDGVVTYAEGYAVQPFSNTVNVLDLTGEQLLQVLEEQVTGSNASSNKILQPSEGLTYTLDLTASGAERIVADSVRINGEALDPDATYRVAVNSFLAGGGDGFSTLAEGTNEVVGGDDLAALASYLGDNSSAEDPIEAPAADRITVVQ